MIYPAVRETRAKMIEIGQIRPANTEGPPSEDDVRKDHGYMGWDEIRRWKQTLIRKGLWVPREMDAGFWNGAVWIG